MRHALRKLADVISAYKALIAANVIAAILAATSWNFYDVRYFIFDWYNVFTRGELLRIYEAAASKVAYPPLSVVIFIFFHHIAISISRSILLIRLIDKLPLLISFNVTYFLLEKYYGRRAGYLWLANPLSYVVISGYQFDLITGALLLSGFIYFWKKRKYFVSGALYVLASMTKQLVAVLYILNLIFLLKSGDKAALKKYLLGGALAGLLTSGPFFAASPRSFIEKVVLFHGERLPQHFSPWALPMYFYRYNVSLLPSWISWAWAIPFAIFMALIFYRAWRYAGFAEEHCVVYTVLLLAGALLLNKVGNNSYYLWLSVFLPIYLLEVRRELSRRILSLYVFVPVVITIVFGLFTIFSSAVVGRSVFLPEDQNWVPAEILIIYSSGADSLIYSTVIFLRTSPSWYAIFDVLDRASFLTMIVITLIYSSYLAYILLDSWKISRRISAH